MFKTLPSLVGHALAGIRPGLEQILYNEAALKEVPETLTLESAAFDAPRLPELFTEDGQGLSPPFSWSGAPPEARSLLLIIEDADSPTPVPLIHAVAFDLAPTDGRLKTGALQSAGYLPPDPPPGHGPHHYAAQIYALDCPSGFDDAPARSAIRDLLHKHAIARGLLVTTYQRA